MRPRTFILLILVLIVGAVAFILAVATFSGGVGSFLGGNSEQTQTRDQTEGEEPGIDLPTPTSTSSPFQAVVVAKVPLPVGEILTKDVMDVELRPVTNIALQGGYTFTSTEQLEGRILRAEVSGGQEILQPMIALNSTDIFAFGSDLALYVPQGEVAVAFPIDQFSGAALTMRPGDKVDVIMTLRVINLDPEYQSAQLNYFELVDERLLLLGSSFLFPKEDAGRFEFIEEINQVGVINPNEENFIPNQDWAKGEQIPKRVTQLTIQHADVLHVGQWIDPRRLEMEQTAAQAAARATTQAIEAGAEPVPVVTPTPLPSRLEENPAMVILSMSIQDALALKYARERNVDIDLVLRSPGDETEFVTTSVSLLQIVDQGTIIIPEPPEIDLFNPILAPTRERPD